MKIEVIDGKADIQSQPLVSNKQKYLICSVLGAMNGALYFFVAAAGADNLKNLFKLEADSPQLDAMIHSMGTGAALCFGTFTYKVLENLTLKPNSAYSALMMTLAPFAGSSFLTAGIEGAELMHVNAKVAVGMGVTLFAFRTLALADSAVKFPEKAKELLSDWLKAVATADYKDMVRLLVTLYTALGFSASATDSVYGAANQIARKLGASEGTGLSITCYISAALGAIGIFPLVFYWTKRGLNQLTYGGKPNSVGEIKDQTDKYTCIAAVATLPVILGSLGSVTAVGGQVFAKAGVTATIVRVTTSALFAVAGGVPGLSAMFRAASATFSSCKSTLFSVPSKIRCLCPRREEIQDEKYALMSPLADKP